MSELLYKTARSAAHGMLNRLWDGCLPVKLHPFAVDLSVEVYTTDLGNTMCGLVAKDPGLPARVVLNSRHVARRRRLTCAHQLGHVVGQQIVSDDNGYSFEELTCEKEQTAHDFFAAEFAGALLMPTAEFQQLLLKGTPEHSLAEQFDVPIAAVKRRIARLSKHPS